jgi:hypothetical protein
MRHFRRCFRILGAAGSLRTLRAFDHQVKLLINVPYPTHWTKTLLSASVQTFPAQMIVATRQLNCVLENLPRDFMKLAWFKI